MNSKETLSNNDTSRIGYNNPYINDPRLMVCYDEYCIKNGTNFANQFRDDVDKNLGFMSDLKEKYGDVFDQVSEGMFVIKNELTLRSEKYIFSPHGIFYVYCPIILTTKGMSNLTPSIETFERIQYNCLTKPTSDDLKTYTIYFPLDTYKEYILYNSYTKSKEEKGYSCGLSFTRIDVNDRYLNKFIKETFDTAKNNRQDL